MRYDFQPLPTRTEVVCDWLCLAERVKTEGKVYVDLADVSMNAAHSSLYRYGVGIYQVKDGLDVLGHVLQPIQRRNGKRGTEA